MVAASLEVLKIGSLVDFIYGSNRKTKTKSVVNPCLWLVFRRMRFQVARELFRFDSPYRP
jgi:hypothetical protein